MKGAYYCSVRFINFGDEPDEKPAVPVPAQEPEFCERGLSGAIADAIQQATGKTPLVAHWDQPMPQLYDQSQQGAPLDYWVLQAMYPKGQPPPSTAWFGYNADEIVWIHGPETLR